MSARFPVGIPFSTVVSPSHSADLMEVAIALQNRHPTMSNDQIREAIVRRGVRGYLDDFNLPRAGSNPDVDG